MSNPLDELFARIADEKRRDGADALRDALRRRRWVADEDIDALRDTLTELARLTTDETPAEVMRRALGVYLSIVAHVRSGGAVRFVNPDLSKRTLKVRVRL